MQKPRRGHVIEVCELWNGAHQVTKCRFDCFAYGELFTFHGKKRNDPNAISEVFFKKDVLWVKYHGKKIYENKELTHD